MERMRFKNFSQAIHKGVTKGELAISEFGQLMNCRLRLGILSSRANIVTATNVAKASAIGVRRAPTLRYFKTIGVASLTAMRPVFSSLGPSSLKK